MSALGQKLTFAPQNAISALPPIATAKATSLRAFDNGQWGCDENLRCERSSDRPHVHPQPTHHHDLRCCRSQGGTVVPGRTKWCLWNGSR